MRRPTTLLCALSLAVPVALAACGDTVYDLAEVPPGATGKTDKPVFNDEGRLIDPQADSDGDGILDGDEVAGWTVTIDGNGFAVLTTGSLVREDLEVRQVTSDPRYADTDGDGLNDGDERRAKCDPRRVDTDGDTLGDYEEVARWGTSPTSADTDGDARGADFEHPRPPIFGLFDAAELRLMKNPLDPNGPLIPGPGATSPLFADTDGDGVGDYDEVLAGKRRATFAEVPKLKFAATEGGALDLYFNIKRSDGRTETTTQGTTTSFDEGGYVTLGTSTRINFERSDYVGAYLKTTDTFGCCLTGVKSESEAGVKYKTDTRLEQAVSFSMDTGAYFNSQHALNEATSWASTQGLEYSSGTIALPLDVINAGPIPVRLKDLVVSVVRADRVTRQVVPVTEIAGQDMSLAPGERRTLELTTHDVPVQAMRDLMADPSSLIFEASRFSLLDQYGLDFDFRMADVMANCAAVSIDFGDHSERFFIAANIEGNNGVSLGMAMTQAGIDFAAEPFDDDALPEGAEVWDITIAGRGTELHEGPAPNLDEAFPYPAGKEPGRRKVKRGWFGAIRPGDGSDEEPPYTANLFDAVIHAGDEITLVYSEDLDRDGVPAYEEARWGSSDLTPHSDGDGMSDYWETRVGWLVETAARAPYRVFSSPAATDTDQDGLDDDQEAEPGVTDAGTGMDPWLGDTDQDGFSDFFEYFDVAYGLDPNRPADLDAIPKPTAACEIVFAPRGDNEPYRYLVHAIGTDPQSDLVELAVDFGGPLAHQQSPPVDRLEVTQQLERCFPNPGVVRVTATDALGFKTTSLCAFGEGAPHQGELCNGVDDDCNGVIDDGCPKPGELLTVDNVPTDTARVTNRDGNGRNTLDCGDRMVRAIKVYSGNLIDKAGVYCTTPRLGQPYIPAGRTENVYPVIFEGYDYLVAEFGGQGANDNSTHLNCADVGATVAMGIEGRAADVIDQLRVVCSSMVVERVNGAYQINNWWTGNTTTRGGDGGSPFGRQCPVGTLPNRVNLWTGSFIDDITLSCARFRVPMVATP